MPIKTGQALKKLMMAGNTGCKPQGFYTHFSN
jgi:hypothetical protein